MIPTRFPWPAARNARLAVRFDFPVPPRNECTEMTFGIGRLPLLVRAGLGGPQRGKFVLEALEVIRCGDLGYLIGFLLLIDSDRERRQEIDMHGLLHQIQDASAETKADGGPGGRKHKGLAVGEWHLLGTLSI